MVHGQLEVQAINARNLRKNQLMGKMDPYMTLRIDQSKIRTRTMKNADREPVWNETFKFQIINNQTVLYVEVWNDNLGSDSLIGAAAVNLEKCFKSGVLDEFIALQDPSNGHPCGECRLVCYFRPTTGLGTQPPGAAPQPAQVIIQSQPAYVVAPPPQQIIYQQQPQLPVFVAGAPQPQPMYAPPHYAPGPAMPVPQAVPYGYPAGVPGQPQFVYGAPVQPGVTYVQPPNATPGYVQPPNATPGYPGYR